MKLKNILIGTLLSASVLSLSGCKGNGDEPSMPSAGPLQLSAEEVTVEEGGTATVTIVSGSGSYLTSVEKTGVVTAVIKDKEIIFHGITTGSDSFMIKDRISGDTKTVRVNVSDVAYLMGIPTQMTISGGLFRVLNVEGGSGDYEVTSADPNKVEVVSVEGSKITLKGIGAGETEITIKDKANGATVTSKATVVLREFKVASTESQVFVGDAFGISITSGNGRYEIVENDNPDLFEFTVNAFDIAIVTKAIGVAHFKIKDVASGETSPFTLTVNARPLKLSREDVVVAIGTSSTLNINDGNGKYTLSVTAGAEYFDAKLEGNEITITSKGVGNGTIMVKDVLSGEEKAITVTVRDLIRRLIPDEGADPITLKKGETKTLTLHINYREGWWTQYITFTVNGDVITAKRDQQFDYDTYMYTYTFTLTGNEVGQTIFTVLNEWDPEDVFLEVPVTVTE